MQFCESNAEVALTIAACLSIGLLSHELAQRGRGGQHFET
jgi:hypothetical protein